MKLSQLRHHSLIYVASPYTRYPQGPDAAFEEICLITSELIARKLNVFSPIAHGHGLSKHGGIPMFDAALWQAIDAPFVAACDALMVAMMPSWRTSKGVAHEIAEFRAAGKPVYYLDPASMTVSVEIRAEVA